MMDAELLQYMVPGSTIHDIMSNDDDDDLGMNYEIIKNKNSTNAVVISDGVHLNSQKEPTSMSKLQPSQHHHNNSKVLAKIHLDAFYKKNGGENGDAGDEKNINRRITKVKDTSIINDLQDGYANHHNSSSQGRKDVDRSERATVENVMDPRTRLILYKMVNTGLLKEINGCVSTGKEANVYYAVDGTESPVALKVYKTSILGFKDRDQYVSGEYRFQQYCKKNPRKMVRTWAEKEARNLNRLQEAGVLAPAVKLLRQHVLVMEFLGENGWPAPRLKEVRFPSFSALDCCYLDLCCTMRKIFTRAKLIHGDLSEYNLLLFKGRVVVIDVSQSVEADHPRAMDFLRRDLVNVTTFFRTKGHNRIFSIQDLFHFITAPPNSEAWTRCTGPDNSDEILDYLKTLRAQKEAQGTMNINTKEAEIDEQVFLNINVPRTLKEIDDSKAPNREMAPFIEKMTTGGHLKAASSSTHSSEASEESDRESEDTDDGDDDDDDSDNNDDGDQEGEGAGSKKKSKGKNPRPKTLAEMTKEERKAHHKAVKEANRARRVEKSKNKKKNKRPTKDKAPKEEHTELAQ